MNNKICFDKTIIVNICIILVIIMFYIYSNYTIFDNKNKSLELKEEKKEKIIYIQNQNHDNHHDNHHNNNHHNNHHLSYNYMNSYDRVYNPLRFPVKTNQPFNYSPCGDRLYDSNDPIYNPHSINYQTQPCNNNLNTNFLNYRTSSQYCDQIQQIGAINKIDGTESEIYPLFGRRKNHNNNQFEYYTMVNGVKLITKPKNNYQELDSNDIIEVNQLSGNYLVSVYNNESLF